MQVLLLTLEQPSDSGFIHILRYWLGAYVLQMSGSIAKSHCGNEILKRPNWVICYSAMYTEVFQCSVIVWAQAFFKQLSLGERLLQKMLDEICPLFNIACIRDGKTFYILHFFLSK